MNIVTIFFSTKSLDHLGSYGQLVEARILNGFGFVDRILHMYPEFFTDQPVERLLGKGLIWTPQVFMANIKTKAVMLPFN
ncbi:MAG: hypothetical protein ACI9T7_000237 [Oleiphilaceae bacterium]|jgi:hypothetical protein